MSKQLKVKAAPLSPRLACVSMRGCVVKDEGGEVSQHLSHFLSDTHHQIQPRYRHQHQTTVHIYTYLQISIFSRIVKVAGHCDVVVGGMEVVRSRRAKYLRFL